MAMNYIEQCLSCVQPLRPSIAGYPNPLPQEVAECVEVVLQNFGEAKADGLLSVAMRAIFM